MRPLALARGTVLGAALAAALTLAGCATLSELASVRNLEFDLDRASDGRLAGVRLDDVRSWQDLSPADAGAIALAVARRDLPLSLTLHVEAENPRENTVAARLVALDWTLLLDGRETIAGSLAREYRVEPGGRVDIPLEIRLDLLRFFEDNASDLLELAAAAAGRSEPRRVALRATPTVETPLGRLRYPGAITITSRDVGGAR